MRLFPRLLLLIPFFCWYALLLLASSKISAAASAASASSVLLDETDPLLLAFVNRFIDILNGAEPLWSETEYAATFSNAFVAQVSLSDFVHVAVTPLQSQGAPWSIQEVVSYDCNAATGIASAVVQIAAPTDVGLPAVYALTVAMDNTDDASNRLVQGFFLQPLESAAPTLENPPKTMQEAIDRLEALGHENFAFVVASSGAADDDHYNDDDNETYCNNILAGSRQDEATPIGSMFKLYVLGALVDAVQQKRIDWDQSVQILEAYRSLPTGIVQNDPPGSNRTVRQLAELMISISDNTAADHLMLGVLGRPAVEQALRDYGHHNPLLNLPFLSTREFFLLKLLDKDFAAIPAGLPGPLGQAYAEADETERRAILADLENVTIDSLTNNDAADIPLPWPTPIAVEHVEWFASPLDLCRVLSLLQKDKEAALILAINPGVPDKRGLFLYIGFKGGGEPGVLGLAWYVREATTDNTATATRVVTGTIWDPLHPIEDESETVFLLGALRDLSVSSDGELNQTSRAASVGKVNMVSGALAAIGLYYYSLL